MRMRRSHNRRNRGLAGRADRRLFGSRSESGFLDAALLLIIFVAIFTLATAIPAVLQELLKGLAGALDFPSQLVHVPGMAGQPLFEATVVPGSGIGSLTPAGLLSVSSIMGELYGKMQIVAFVGFIAAAIIMGITYASEQFNLVSKGTAFQLLSESGLILVLLFIFPIIYNASAAAVNMLDQQVILQGKPVEMVSTVTDDACKLTTSLEAYTNLQGIALNIFSFNLAPLLFALIQAIGTIGVLFATFFAGIGRLLIIGILVGAFPVILILRLIPPLRDIAAQLQGALIGLMVGTVLVSFAIRISYGISATLGFNSLLRWGLGLSTLVAAAALMFSVAGAFGRVGRSIMGTGAAAGAGAGGLLGTTTGVMLGAGMAAGAATGRVSGLKEVPTSEKMAAIGRAALAGGQAGIGGPTTAIVKAPSAGLETAEVRMAAATKKGLYGPETPLWLKSADAIEIAAERAEKEGLDLSDLKNMGRVVETRMNFNALAKPETEGLAAFSMHRPKGKLATHNALRTVSHLVKSGELSHAEMAKDLKDGYVHAKSVLGEDRARIGIGYMYYKTMGTKPYQPAESAGKGGQTKAREVTIEECEPKLSPAQEKKS